MSDYAASRSDYEGKKAPFYYFLSDYIESHTDYENKKIPFYESTEEDIMKLDFIIQLKGGFKGESQMMGAIKRYDDEFEKKKEHFEFLERIDTEEFILHLYKKKN